MSTSGGGGYLLHATHIVINGSLPIPIPSYMEQKDILEETNKSSDNNNAIDEINVEIELNDEEELQEVSNKKVKLDL